jgi:hypothetical protein
LKSPARALSALAGLLVAAAPDGDALGFFEQADQFVERPGVVRDPGGHGRGAPVQALVGPAEVVVEEVQRDGRGQVLQLL